MLFRHSKSDVSEKRNVFLDTGSNPSLVESKALHEDWRVNTDQVFKVSGIVKKEIMTLGTVQIYVMEINNLSTCRLKQTH